MKTWTLKVNEDELRALINHHSQNATRLYHEGSNITTDISARIHDLTKRLNKETPEIENETIAQQQENAPATATGQGW